MILVLEISQFVLTPLLFLHAMRSRSTEFALLFWGGGFLLGFVREFSVLRLLHLYTFGDYYVTMLGIPLVWGVFWSNAIYLAFQATRAITMIDAVQGPVSSRALLIMAAITALIGVLNDFMAVRYELIAWTSGASFLPGGTPLERLLEFGMVAILYILAFRSVRAGPWNTTRRFIGLILLNPILIVLELGLMLLFRFFFSFLFG